MRRSFRNLVAISFILFSACNAQSKVEATPVNSVITEAAVERPSNVLIHWQIRQDESQLTFSAIQDGTPFTGEFLDFNAEIAFDPDNLDGSKITGQVNTKEVATGNGDIDNTLPAKDWLWIKKFPTAQFVSDAITLGEDGTYIAAGHLTIRDISLPIDLNFDLEIVNGVATAKGRFSFERLDFGLGGGKWAGEDWAGPTIDVEMTVIADAIK